MRTYIELDALRALGFVHVAVAPEDYDPDMGEVEHRVFTTDPGFRAWAFKTQDECAEFRRRLYA